MRREAQAQEPLTLNLSYLRRVVTHLFDRDAEIGNQQSSHKEAHFVFYTSLQPGERLHITDHRPITYPGFAPHRKESGRPPCMRRTQAQHTPDWLPM